MQVHLTKWGNSLGLRIPREIARRFRLSEGMRVDVAADGERIVIALDRPRYRLEDLLVGSTPEAMRDAFDWGPDVGREAVDEQRLRAGSGRPDLDRFRPARRS